MLSEGMTLEEAMQAILGDMHYAVTQKTPVRYQCNCTREKMERALISIGKQERETLIREDHKAEIVCQFCNKAYQFNQAELGALLRQATQR